MQKTERCVLYARKSTDREDKQILSIPAQLDELREFATREQLVVADELVEHCSAREPGRPIFSQLLRDVGAGRVHRILCWKLDRLARNPIDGGALIHYLGKGLLQELVTVDGRYTGAGDSKFMLSVLFGAATKMTDDLSVGVKRGNKAVNERGRITGVPPTGYIKIRDNDWERGAGKVVPDPDRFDTIRKIWEHALAGDTVMAIRQKAIDDWGFTLRATRQQPQRLPSISNFYRMLTNRFYAGQIVSCGDVYQGEHTPVVTLSEYERVQQLLHRADAPRPSQHAFLYKGLLRCAACGCLMTGEIHKGRYVYYRCGKRRSDRPTCRAPGPSEEQVTRDLEQSLARLTLPPELATWTLQAMDTWLDKQSEARLAEVQAHEEELRRIARQLPKLLDLLVAGTLSEQEYVEQKSRLLERQASLKRMIEEPTATEQLWRSEMERVLRSSIDFGTSFRNGSQEQRRQLVNLVYANCLVQDRTTKPTARFPYSVLAEAPLEPPSVDGGSANYPTASALLRNKRKNAHPRDTRERALLTWCTKVIDARTKMEQIAA